MTSFNMKLKNKLMVGIIITMILLLVTNSLSLMTDWMSPELTMGIIATLGLIEIVLIYELLIVIHINRSMYLSKDSLEHVLPKKSKELGDICVLNISPKYGYYSVNYKMRYSIGRGVVSIYMVEILPEDYVFKQRRKNQHKDERLVSIHSVMQYTILTSTEALKKELLRDVLSCCEHLYFSPDFEDISKDHKILSVEETVDHIISNDISEW